VGLAALRLITEPLQRRKRSIRGIGLLGYWAHVARIA
jgi:hypothetical protein